MYILSALWVLLFLQLAILTYLFKQNMFGFNKPVFEEPAEAFMSRPNIRKLDTCGLDILRSRVEEVAARREKKYVHVRHFPFHSGFYVQAR